MAQFFEFLLAHYLLAGTFLVLLTLFIANEMNRGGAIINNQLLVSLINSNQGVVLDLRDQKAYGEGHIKGAFHLPYTEVQDRLGELEKYIDKTLILACQFGQHSSVAGTRLRKAGFKDVRRLEGGMGGWRQGSMPVVKN